MSADLPPPPSEALPDLASLPAPILDVPPPAESLPAPVLDLPPPILDEPAAEPAAPADTVLPPSDVVLPPEQSTAKPEPHEAPSEPAADAPPQDDWVESQDGQGRPYYWNKTKNVTTWEKPKNVNIRQAKKAAPKTAPITRKKDPGDSDSLKRSESLQVASTKDTEAEPLSPGSKRKVVPKPDPGIFLLLIRSQLEYRLQGESV